MSTTEATKNTGTLQEPVPAALFRSMLDHAAAAMLLADANGLILFANEAAYQLWQYPTAQLPGNDYRQLFDLPDAHLLKTLEPESQHTARHMHLTGRKKDNTLFNCDCSVSFFQADTAGSYIMVTVTDTTAFAEREEQLRMINDRYRYAAKASHDAIWDWDISNDILFWSDSYNDLFGGAVESNCTNISSWHNRIHKEDRARVIDNIHNVLRKGLDNWLQEYRYRRADGSYAWVTDRGIIINDGTGLPCRMIGVMQDASDLREAEKELAREQKLLQTLADNIPDYIYVKDTGLDTLMSNQALSRLLKKNQPAATALTDLMDPETAMLHRQDDTALLTTGNALINRQEAITPADGRKRWLLTSKLPLHDEHGNISGIIGISRDITERVKKNEQNDLFLRITDIINTHSNLSDALKAATEQIARYTGAAVTEAWTISVDKRELLLKAQYHAVPDHTGMFGGEAIKLHEGEGLPGTAWEHRQTIWRTNIRESRNFYRKEAAEQAGLQSAVAIPVINNDEVVAVFCFYSHDNEPAALQEYNNFFLLLQQQLGPYMHSKRSEDELQKFFSLSPDLLCVAGTDGYFKKINNTFCKLLGFSEAEMLAHPYYYFVHPEDINHTAHAVHQLSEGTYIHYFENRYRTSDGRYKWFAWTSTPLTEEHVIFAVGKDITEKKRLQDIETLEKEVLELNTATGSTLENTVAYYLQKIESMQEGVTGSVLILENGRLYNLASAGLPEEYRKKIEGIRIGEGHGSCGTAAFRKEKVIVTDIETDPLWEKYVHLALPYGYKACWSFPIIGSNRKVLGTFAFYYKDNRHPRSADEHIIERATNLLSVIMENKIAEKELLLSNERYNLVAKATNDAIWDRNIITGEMIRTGNGFLKLFGYAETQVPDGYRFWQNKVHPEDLPYVLQKQEETLNNSTGHYWEDEYRFLRADDTYAYVTDRGYILRNEQGRAVRMIGATQDITQRKQTELLMKELNERLVKRAHDLSLSNAELERFAYVASHDLQEPLRMISGFMQLLLKKYAPVLDEKAMEYIAFATDGAERMKQLILDLLEYSRINTDKTVTAMVDMNTVVQQVSNIFAATIQETGAVIHTGPMPVINARKTQMLQIMQNMVGNALKYRSSDPPVIETGSYETNAHWVFFVRDNGIGIDPHFYEKIFVIFQRLHNRSEYSGTGIGLAICKKIAELHGGRIWVEPAAGNGSCFYFSIAKNYFPDT